MKYILVLLPCVYMILYSLFNSPYTHSPSLQTLMKTILPPPSLYFNTAVPNQYIEELN